MNAFSCLCVSHRTSLAHVRVGFPRTFHSCTSHLCRCGKACSTARHSPGVRRGGLPSQRRQAVRARRGMDNIAAVSVLLILGRAPLFRSRLERCREGGTRGRVAPRAPRRPRSWNAAVKPSFTQALRHRTKLLASLRDSTLCNGSPGTSGRMMGLSESFPSPGRLPRLWL